MDFGRRRHNKLKRLHFGVKNIVFSAINFQWKHKNYIKNRCNMMIRPFISMKSISSCVFWWSPASKTINLMSFLFFTSKENLKPMEKSKIKINRIKPHVQNHFKNILAMPKIDFHFFQKNLKYSHFQFLQNNKEF